MGEGHFLALVEMWGILRLLCGVRVFLVVLVLGGAAVDYSEGGVGFMVGGEGGSLCGVPP